MEEATVNEAYLLLLIKPEGIVVVEVWKVNVTFSEVQQIHEDRAVWLLRANTSAMKKEVSVYRAHMKI